MAADVAERAGPANLPTAQRREWLHGLAVLCLGGAALAFAWSSDYQTRILAVVGLGIIAASGLNILTGLTGQMSLGHAGFYAVGAYSTALLSVRYGWPILLTVPVGLVLSGVLGVLLAWPSLRLRGPYLTMVTIAFGLIIYGGAVDFVGVTNGPQGVFPVPPIAVAGSALSLHGLNVVLLFVVAATVYASAALINSRFGRAMRAVQGNEIAAASLGVNVVGIKVMAFAISGVFAGLAGILFAPLNGFVNPDSFTLDLSVQILLIVILGGRGTVWGPVTGAVALTVIDRMLSGVGDARLVAYGAILLGVLYAAPEGIVGLSARLRHRYGRRPVRSERSSAQGAPPTSPLPAQRHDAAEVVLEGLDKAFGGLKAVSGVSFRVRPSTIYGIVGPNGAGKTTVLNLISGVTEPTAGRVLLGETELSREPMHRIAAAGVARTFQNLALFADMTVLENVLVGQHLADETSLPAALLGLSSTASREATLRRQALALLAFVGLSEVADERAANLPQGHQRLLEIARALAVRPRVLLLDEPAAGLNATEVTRLVELVRRIGRSGITVMLIEHHMQLVMSVCERLAVLDFGQLIAEGPPEAVRRDARVVEAYLGKPREIAGEVSLVDG